MTGGAPACCALTATGSERAAASAARAKSFIAPILPVAPATAAEPAIRVVYGPALRNGRPPGHQLELGPLRVLEEDGRIGVEVDASFDITGAHRREQGLELQHASAVHSEGDPGQPRLVV